MSQLEILHLVYPWVHLVFSKIVFCYIPRETFPGKISGKFEMAIVTVGWSNMDFPIVFECLNIYKLRPTENSINKMIHGRNLRRILKVNSTSAFDSKNLILQSLRSKMDRKNQFKDPSACFSVSLTTKQYFLHKFLSYLPLVLSWMLSALRSVPNWLVSIVHLHWL